MKKYLVVSYAVLVKAGVYDLEQTEGSTNKVVPESYKMAVAEYLAAQDTASTTTQSNTTVTGQ
jgi:hypothetical protein